jgi:hypothetical protein
MQFWEACTLLPALLHKSFRLSLSSVNQKDIINAVEQVKLHSVLEIGTRHTRQRHAHDHQSLETHTHAHRHT